MNVSSEPISLNDCVNQLKSPLLTRNIQIRSDDAHKSYNELYHTIYLPLVGDYSNNFLLMSNYILKPQDYTNTLSVDCINNYIECISLCINNREAVISLIDNFAPIDLINNLQQFDKVIIPLKFLNLPLFTKCCTNSSFLINIKFRQIPPINYILSYDVMFVDDIQYSHELSQHYFIVTYTSQQKKNTHKTTQLGYNKGCVILVGQ